MALTTHFLTVEEVAEYCRVNKREVYRWLKHGVRRGDVTYKLKGRQIVRGWRITMEDLEAFLEAANQPVAEQG